jgi:hypothetical protein
MTYPKLEISLFLLVSLSVFTMNIFLFFLLSDSFLPQVRCVRVLYNEGGGAEWVERGGKLIGQHGDSRTPSGFYSRAQVRPSPGHTGRKWTLLYSRSQVLYNRGQDTQVESGLYRRTDIESELCDRSCEQLSTGHTVRK